MKRERTVHQQGWGNILQWVVGFGVIGYPVADDVQYILRTLLQLDVQATAEPRSANDCICDPGCAAATSSKEIRSGQES